MPAALISAKPEPHRSRCPKVPRRRHGIRGLRPANGRRYSPAGAGRTAPTGNQVQRTVFESHADVGRMIHTWSGPPPGHRSLPLPAGSWSWPEVRSVGWRGGVEVLDQDERHAGLLGQMRQQQRESLSPRPRPQCPLPASALPFGFSSPLLARQRCDLRRSCQDRRCARS